MKRINEGKINKLFKNLSVIRGDTNSMGILEEFYMGGSRFNAGFQFFMLTEWPD